MPIQLLVALVFIASTASIVGIFLLVSRQLKSARDKNLDRATLAFNQVTTKCVECHKYVRGIRMADSSK